MLSKTHHDGEPRKCENVADNIDRVQLSAPSPRLPLLKHLVEEVINEPEFASVDPELSKAVSMLDDAFRNVRRAALPSDGTSSASEISETCHTTHTSGYNGLRAPVLPPILDDRLESAVFTHPACGSNNDSTYDRLEVLGDAYIELIATRIIWGRFPGISSGRISQIRELLVKNETLSAFAEAYGFDRKISVPANYSDQPKRWTKIKGDVFEAYVAAVILSHSIDGYHVAEKWLTQLWLPKLDSLGHQKAEFRYKETLAKKVMGKGTKLEYREEKRAIDHKGSGTQTFFIGVYLTGWGKWKDEHLGSGQGSSKAAAGDEAARDALSTNASLISNIAAVKEASLARK
jgi:ribonuclease-3